MSLADRQKWDAKYASAENAPHEPSAVLLSLAEFLPTTGRALDVAGGGGRHAIWLAGRGLDVTLADVSPVGLALARQRAATAGVVLDTLQIDLEQESLPAPPYDVIVSAYYFCRALMGRFSAHLNPGGVLIVIQPTKLNLQRHAKPPAEYLFEPGELRQLVGGLEVLHYAEGWMGDDRHNAVLVARRPIAD